MESTAAGLGGTGSDDAARARDGGWKQTGKLGPGRQGLGRAGTGGDMPRAEPGPGRHVLGRAGPGETRANRAGPGETRANRTGPRVDEEHKQHTQEKNPYDRKALARTYRPP